MSPVQALLVDLVALAESPLYSAYRWVGRQLGHDVSFSEFLSTIEGLIRRDILRLWVVDESYDRTELFQVPSDLDARYGEVGHDDATYDPFGYSLTLGPKGNIDAQPEWEVNIDFQEGTFEVLTRDPDLAPKEVMVELARYYPDVSLTPVTTVPIADGQRILGKLSVADTK